MTDDDKLTAENVPDKDPGNQWSDHPLSVRIANAKAQWLNIGERQGWMMDNFAISAEWLEAQLEKAKKSTRSEKGTIDSLRSELAAVCVAVGRSKDGTGTDVDWFELHKEVEKLAQRANIYRLRYGPI